jgi:osmotically-inducible protein OsmY
MQAPKFARILVLFCLAAMAGCAGTSRDATVAVSHVPDDELSRRVETALNTAPETRDFKLDARAFRGIVMLIGYVESAEIKTKAEKIAAEVAGVTEVRNSIEIRLDSRRKDSLSAGS